MKFTHEIVRSNEDLSFTLYAIDTDRGPFPQNVPSDYKPKIVPKHWHNHIEIIYILDGSLEVSINNFAYELKNDQLIVINSNDIHSTYFKDRNTSILLQIPYEFLQNNIADYKNIYFECNPYMDNAEGIAAQNELKLILRSLKDIYQNKPKHYKLEANSLIYKLLSILVEKFSVSDESSKVKNSARYLERLNIIINYVNLHYMESISLDEISSIAGLSPVYFSRFFKEYMGTTFVKYLNTIRLEHFYIDLTNSDCSISELAEKNGFVNYKVFMKLFKDTYGCAPSEIRKLIQKTKAKNSKL